MRLDGHVPPQETRITYSTSTSGCCSRSANCHESGDLIGDAVCAVSMKHRMEDAEST